MKIAIDARHISNLQPGGYKSYTRQLLSALGKYDRENEYLIYFDRPFDGTTRFPFEQFNFRISPSGGHAAGALWREQWSLPRRAVQDGAELLHCTGNTGPVVSKVPLILTIHDAILFLPLHRKWKPNGRTPGMKQRLISGYERSIIPLAASQARKIITVTEQSRQDLHAYAGVDLDLIEVVPIGVDERYTPLPDPEAVRDRISRRFSIDSKYALCLGSVDPRKNISFCFQAFNRSSPAGLTLAVVSSHPAATNMLREQAAALGVERILFLEKVTDEELVDLYNAAAVFLFPSLYEGFGLPPLEAMACGTPVIALPRPCLPEVLGDAVRYVQPGDVQDFRAAIEEIASDEKVRAHMRDAGLARVRLYTYERLARETVRIYKSAGLI